MARSDGEHGLALASFGLALAAAGILLVAPLGSSVEAQPVDGRAGPERVTRESLVQQEGWWVAVPLAVPVGISGAAVLLGRGTWRRPVRAVAAILLTAFVVVGIFSIGLFYLPAAGAMFGAAASAPPSEAGG